MKYFINSIVRGEVKSGTINRGFQNNEDTLRRGNMEMTKICYVRGHTKTTQPLMGEGGSKKTHNTINSQNYEKMAPWFVYGPLRF